MRVKYAKDIIKEIQARGSIQVLEGYITGEAFEEWLEGKERFEMSISEQVKELRETAELFDKIDDGRRMLLQAADAIEALSAKLAEANMDRSDRYYGGGWICDRAPTKEECGRWRGKFLVTVYANKPTVMYMEYEYTEIRGKEVGRWIWCDKVNIPWEVIAWRKFPDPYRP